MLNRDTMNGFLCTSLNCTGEFCVMIIGIIQLEPLALSQRGRFLVLAEFQPWTKVPTWN